MKRCKVCGTSYKDNSEFCLKCNLPLVPSASSPVNKSVTPKHEDFDPQLLEEKIYHDFIQDLSKKIVKVSVHHPLPDNTVIKKFFALQSTMDSKNSSEYYSVDIEIPLEKITLQFQVFLLSNVRIVESTRNTDLQDSLFYIIIHFFNQSYLEVVRKQLIGIDSFVEEYSRKIAIRYPLAIIGLHNSKSDEEEIDQEKKDNFQFDLQSIISKIRGLEDRFVIKNFDFSNKNIIDFKELGRFYFERFLKDQKVPKFDEN